MTLQRDEPGQPRTPVHPTTGRLHFARYLAALFSVCFLLYPAPFFLLRLPSFERWGGSSFGPALDFGFQAPHTNADILIFGDSSAAVGLDPRQISATLGLKVLNLPNTGASLHVIGDMNLRRYLATNTPPRLIVFYFTPWNLDYAHEPAGPRIYEGEEMLVRHGTLRQITAFASSHLVDALQFPFRFYSANPPNAIRTALRREHPSAAVAQALGHADPLTRRPPLQGPCTFPPDLTTEKPAATALALIQTYRTARTDLLFYLAPMPACDNVSEFTKRRYPALAAEPPQVLPVSWYKMDFAYAHLLPSAVPSATASLTQAIQKRLAANTLPAAPAKQ